MSERVLELCMGRVMHVRMRPFVHRFAYRVFCLRLRIDNMPAVDKLGSWLFGVERARPVSFYARDHGARDGSDLMAWLENRLLEANLHLELGCVWLQCFPRVFGYVFNPVSFWFIYDKQGALRAILAEVNNTFGQRHQYLLTASEQGPITADTVLKCDKVFHVSPFFPVSGEYAFNVKQARGVDHMAIDYFDPVNDLTPVLRTALIVHRSSFSTRSLLKALLSMPMMTLGVMLRIHLQALKLWRRGAKYHPIPALPNKEMTDNTGASK